MALNYLIKKSTEKLIDMFLEKSIQKFKKFCEMEFQAVPPFINDLESELLQKKKNSAGNQFVEDLDKLTERLRNTFRLHTGSSIKEKLVTLRDYRLKFQLLFSFSAYQAQMIDQNSALNKRVRKIQHDFDVLNALLDMHEQLARNEETLVQSIRNNILYLLPVKTLRLSCQRAFQILTRKKEDSQEQMVDQISAINPLPVVKALDKLIERLADTFKLHNGILKEELEKLREIRLMFQPLLSAATQVQIIDVNSEFNKLIGKIDDEIKKLNVLLDVFEFIQPEEQQAPPSLCCECALKIDSNSSQVNDIRA